MGRFIDFLNEEDIVAKALGVEEPETGDEYSEEYAKEMIGLIKAAIEKVNGEKDPKVKEPILMDLKDKLEKWENLDKSTEVEDPPADTEPMEPEEEEPVDEEPEEEDEDEEEEEDEDEEDEKANESLRRFFDK